MRTKVIAAGSIAVVGVIVAGRALHQNDTTNPVRPPGDSLNLLPVPEGADFRRLTAAEDIERYINSISTQTVRGGSDAIRLIEVPDNALTSLADSVAARLRSALEPDRVDWRELARQAGGEFPDPNAIPQAIYDQSAEWDRWWNKATYADAETVQIRKLYLDNERKYINQMTTISTRNSLSAMYNLDDPSRVVEVLIPVRAPLRAGGTATKSAHLGFSFWWSHIERRWRPHMIWLYTDGAGGENIVPPPM